MSKAIRIWIILVLALGLILPVPALASEASPSAVVNVTILHTNDFHGNLEPVPASSYPGISRLATHIKTHETSAGAENTLLLDAGDIMQGSLLSNLKKGEPTIDLYNYLGYDAATFGNHEFDWGQDILKARVTQATFPFVVANLVTNDTGDCTTAGWTSPTFVQPYVTKMVGPAGSQAKVAIIGVTSIETPYITLAAATEGLCFKDPFNSISHYYDQIKADGADAIVVLSHNGLNDGGYGYGFTVTGDKTLAGKLADAGKPVALIIGGHSHTNMAAAEVVKGITVVQAHSAGRKLGKATLAIDTATDTTTVTWERITVNMTDTPDPATQAEVDTWTNDPAYQNQINQVIGYTNIALTRNYNGDSTMGAFIQDAVYGDLNGDSVPANDVDMVFNNAGGIRADITGPTYPYTLTYGSLFNVLPFGNQTVVGDMSGTQILDLLHQSATLFKGAIQVAGIQYSFYTYTDTLPGPQPYAWGAFDVEVKNRTSGTWEPLDLTKTYKVATNEFLAPAGQDGFLPFKYMTNLSYWGDMLDGVDRYVANNYGTPATAYNVAMDGRITRDGDGDTVYEAGEVVPLTILHHNDSHGRLLKSGTFQGYSQLVTLINQERLHNSNRTLLLSAGDNIQGDSMMYYFKSAGLGHTADGTALPAELQINPLIKAFNLVGYDAMTLGNHEFNFGTEIFGTLSQANFPILQANVTDSGAYGLAAVPVEPYITKTVGPEGIKVAVLGIGNHRVPSYELPSNIPGLTFTDPIQAGKDNVPTLQANNDAVIALTHIGFTTDPKSVEVDNNVDTYFATQVAGVDAIIGGHSHTNPVTGFGPYKFLPTYVAGPDNKPVIINQAYRYNTNLGEVVLGLLPDGAGGYKVVSSAGRYIAVNADPTKGTLTPEDPAIVALVQPYQDIINTYNNTQIGQTTVPIDTLKAFTEETNGANLQADASVWALAQKGITVDFHLSGAMTNRKIADAATEASPVTLTINDMFSAMPYENSLVVMNMNGPQLKRVLERAYRNYYYYKYVPGYGGYSYYTTCMLDTNSVGKITYQEGFPFLPNGNNVKSLVVNGKAVDFDDATKFYKVSSVNYLAAGACNFSDAGVSLWPLDQIVNDTQYYVRDVVIDYIKAQTAPISPAIEGRLVFRWEKILPIIFRP